jgi:hypothetical protein
MSETIDMETATTHRRISLIVLLGVPFTEQNYKRSGVAYLEHLFDVTVIDCNRWLYPAYASLSYQRHAYEKRIEVDSFDALLRVLTTIRPAFAIDSLSPSPLKQKIRQELFRLCIPLVVKRSGWCPHLSGKQLFLHLLRHNSLDLVRRLFRRLVKRNAAAAVELPPDIALVAGRSASEGMVKARVTEIAIAADDVHYLNEAKRTYPAGSVAVRNKVLFLDDCIAEAKDYVLLGLPFPVDPDRYYTLLRRSFDIVERACDCRVVVAAHPDGLLIPGYAEKFGSREVHFGRTAALVLEAKLVLGHASTSFSFAVLEEIPAVLLTCRELHASFKGAHILAFQHALGAPLVFMEEEGKRLASACREARVDKACYLAYEEEFLMTSQGHEERPWDAFSRYAGIATAGMPVKA